MENHTTRSALELDVLKENADAEYIGEAVVVLKTLHQLEAWQEAVKRMDSVFLALCTKGTALFEVGEKVYKAGKGSLVLFMPGQMVRLCAIKPGSDGIGIGFSRKFLEGSIVAYSDLWALLLEAQNEPHIRLRPDEARSVARMHMQLLESNRMPAHPFKTEMMSSLMRAMIYQIAIMVSSRIDSLPMSHPQRFELYYKFSRLVAQYFHRSRSVAFYADRLYVTPKYLSSAVKAVSGKTAGRWIDEYVVIEARNRLRTSSLSIRQISDSLNFPDPSFFTKYFKKNTGMTPSEYREKYGR